MMQWNCSSFSAVESGITAHEKCIEKVYPLKNNYRYTFVKTPLPQTPTPRPERGGGVNDRASHVSAAKAAIQTLPRKNKR